MNKNCIIMLLATAMLTMACGNNDVKVQKTVYDTNEEVFLEQGKMHRATTQFTDEEMLQRLCDRAWQRAYAFYYDYGSVGRRNEIVYSARNYYAFSADGSAYMGDLDDYRERVDFTWTVQGHNVTLTSPQLEFTMRVVAIDDTLMVTDTRMTGYHILDYDDATVCQRTVFNKVAVPLPPL